MKTQEKSKDLEKEESNSNSELPKGVKMVGHRWSKTTERKVSFDGKTYQITGVAHTAAMVRANVLEDGEYVPVQNVTILKLLYATFKIH